MIRPKYVFCFTAAGLTYRPVTEASLLRVICAMTTAGTVALVPHRHVTFAGDRPEIIDVGVPDEYAVTDPALESDLRDALVPVLGEPGRR